VNHNIIYSITTDKCIGFDLYGKDTFFLVTKKLKVIMLKRCEDGRELENYKILELKEMN
jgi:hypothetical protein